MDNLLGIIIVVLLLVASIGPFLITLFSRRYPRESKSFNSSSRQNAQVTPATSPGSLMDLDRLRVELRDRYKRTRNLADLDAAISISQQIVQATPLDSSNRPERMNSLGAALLDRYGRTKNVADLNAAITAFQQAVQATSSDSPDQPLYLDNLSVGFRNRYLLSKILADLQAAISASQQAVQATPVGSTGRPRRLNNLSLGLRDRSALSGIGKALDLEEAISASRQAVQATPPDAAERPSYLNNLGAVLHRRYKIAQNVADLEEAITAFQQAVQVTPPDAAERPTYVKNLNLGLRDHSTLPGNQAGMEPSPTGSQPVTQTASSPSYHQFMYLNLLGRELFNRYENVGDLADLHAAISAVQRAIQVMPTGLPDGLDLLSYLDTLGRELFNRYTDTRSVADLEAAITAFQHVVQAASPDAADRPEYLNHLGVGLRVRYERTRNIADLETAISASQQAVEAAPLDLPERPELLRNLGIAQHDYYIHIRDQANLHSMHIRDQADLKAAITAFQQAVEDTPAKSPDRSIQLTSLGAGLLDLYKCTKNRADLEAAITTFQQAVEATSSGSPEQPLLLANLGTGLLDRYEYTKNPTDLEKAIRVSQQAVEAAPLDLPERPGLLRNVGLMLVEHFHTTLNPASLEAAISIWEQNWSIQNLRFAALPVTYQHGQQHEGEEVASDLVTAYLEQAEANGQFILNRGKQHHLRFLSVPPRTLEIVEGSKSRLLTQVVGRGPLRLPLGLSPDIAVRERHLLDELTTLDTEELATHDRPVLTQKEFGGLQQLRQRQMFLHDLEHLWAQIAHDSPEGAEYVTWRRGDVPTWRELTDLAKALGPETALLSFFLTQEEALLFLLRAGWRAPRVIGIPMNETDRADLWETLRREVHIPRTGERWDQPLRPLLANAQHHLKGVKRLILAPAGIGHLLPWAVLAERVGLYTPTGLPLPLVTLPALSVLPRLQQRLRVSKGQALVIGNPLGDRPYMEDEARAVAERFGATPLLRDAATKQAVLANLERASLIHLATHAFFDPENPLDSGIVLAGEEILTAREILQHRLQTDLLVLSSCESGQVGFLGGEELAGLSQAFLQAGVRSLLVSLWQVDDEATAAFIQAFYIEWQEERVDKAQALRQAMTQIQQDPQHPNWSHPYYWGAFVLVGDWD